ncbi:hypothetical protein BDZ45DRAFT_735834 [Acephala macrosclerotiorum]|nr:hypothetical protein BDZ45DRAFT_735834 [Acephala macrosclerotiorum]
MPPKRAPLDSEQLLCAIIKVCGHPRSAENWQKVVALLPDKPNPEQARGRWRGLRAKWEEEDIRGPKKLGEHKSGIEAGSGGEAQAPKVKKGKAKALAKKVTKTKSDKMLEQMILDSEEVEEDKGSETEDVDMHTYFEDSDVGINVPATKKSIRQAKTACPEEIKEEHEEGDENLEDEDEV